MVQHRHSERLISQVGNEQLKFTCITHVSILYRLIDRSIGRSVKRDMMDSHATGHKRILIRTERGDG